MQEFFTILSLIFWIACLIVILKQPEVNVAGYNMGPIARILFMLALISLVGFAFIQLYWIGKFLLLPLQLLLDTWLYPLLGTFFW